jgi:F0F1-type ATP synthase membrane subunit b/b'
VKRATLFIVALALLAAAPLRASVKPTQETKRPAATASGQATQVPAAEAQHGGGAADPGRETVAQREAEVEHGKGEAAESPLATVARLFNFALLAGSLIYLLRSPFGAFLEGRRQQIRKSLTDAAATRAEASRQLAAIDGKLEALPGELDSLKQRGAAEIAAEEERIHQAAAAERQRMLEHARREIERRVQVAERQLQRRTGELAVSVATERVKRTITDADQSRLVDRYLEQVRPATIGS